MYCTHDHQIGTTDTPTSHLHPQQNLKQKINVSSFIQQIPTVWIIYYL